MILAGDIGGTKCLFGLFEGGRCLVQRRLASADFPDFPSALGHFLMQVAPSGIEAACFAVAGPVNDDGRGARLTNLPWVLDADALQAAMGLPRVRLVNDFAAAALGCVTGADSQRVSLQAGVPLAGAPCLVLGAGTGLGVALALPERGCWRIVPGEGGHIAFAPADVQQMALWQFLQQRYGRVIWEHVVSGPGLAAIHEFLADEQCSPEQIGKVALNDGQSKAASSLDMFLAAYGAFAGDMALSCLARGGVFLAGGIAGKILPAMQGSERPFLRSFADKAGHAHLMPAMPVHVVTDPAVGLRGAAMMGS